MLIRAAQDLVKYNTAGVYDYMLQKMRDNTQSWVTKLIIGLICLAFAVWGLETLVMPGGSGEKKIAEVNGNSITQAEYYNALQSLQNQMVRQQMPVDVSQLHQDVMNSLIQQAVLMSYAEKHHMTVSSNEIDGLITSMSAFQINGRFDNQQFSSLISNAGMTPLSFKANLRKDLLLTQMSSAIVNSAFITSTELSNFSKLQQQKRDIQWAELKLSSFEKRTMIKDDVIESYYKSHLNDFMTEPRVKVDYVVLTQDSFAKDITPSDSSVQSAYQAYITNANASVVPKVAVILLKTNDKKENTSQLQQASQIEKEIAKGENFGKLAAKYSDDKATVEKQGYLGEVTPSFYGEAFDKALALLKPGEVSSPVVTKFGVIIIKRVDDGKATVKPFAKMRESLVQQLKQKLAQRLFQDTSQKLADISFEAADLVQPAKQFKLAIKTTPFFNKSGEKGILENKAFVQAAFGDDVLNNNNNSDIIHLSPSEVAVLHVKNYQPARQKTLAEVHDEVGSILKRQQGEKDAKAAVKKIVAELGTGKTVAEVASTYGIEWTSINNASRQQKDVPLQVIQKAFSLPHPEKRTTFGDVELASGDWAVVGVSKVIAGDGKLPTSTQHLLEKALSSSKGQMDYQDFVRGLKNKASIKILIKNPNE